MPPLAAGPDVIVITDKSTKLCQAKYYKNGYDPSRKDLEPELRKLGAASEQTSNRDPCPATTLTLSSLHGHNKIMTRQFIVPKKPCAARKCVSTLHGDVGSECTVEYVGVEPVWFGLLSSEENSVHDDFNRHAGRSGISGWL